MDIRDLVPWGRERGVSTPRRREDPFSALHREMNRMFEDFGRSFYLAPWSDWDGEGFRPQTDVRETDDAGVDGSIVVEKVKDGAANFGFNARSEEYGDLVEAGVIDPTKVVRTALQNAASVASLLLTTEALVAQKPEKKKGAAGMPDMSDMDM